MRTWRPRACAPLDPPPRRRTSALFRSPRLATLRCFFSTHRTRLDSRIHPFGATRGFPPPLPSARLSPGRPSLFPAATSQPAQTSNSTPVVSHKSPPRRVQSTSTLSRALLAGRPQLEAMRIADHGVHLASQGNACGNSAAPYSSQEDVPAERGTSGGRETIDPLGRGPRSSARRGPSWRLWDAQRHAQKAQGYCTTDAAHAVNPR